MWHDAACKSMVLRLAMIQFIMKCSSKNPLFPCEAGARVTRSDLLELWGALSFGLTSFAGAHA